MIEKTVLTILGLVIPPIVSYKTATRKAKNDYYNKALQNRYHLVYTPLRSLLLETHITGCRRGFYLDQRVRRSLPYFRRLRFKGGFKRLSKNFGADPKYEVEFGSDFPLKGIKEIVRKHGKWADYQLLNLIQAADRSSYESRGEPNGLLEIEKFRLAEHIRETHERLNKRLSPEVKPLW